MQKEMRKLVREIKRLMTYTVNGSSQGIMNRLQQIAVRLENLTFQFPELKHYRLTVSGIDMPDGPQFVDTVLPVMFADLAIAGKAKPPNKRSARERAAMTLLPVAIEEATAIDFPMMTARNVSIELVDD